MECIYLAYRTVLLQTRAAVINHLHETGRLLNTTALAGGFQLLRLHLTQLSQTVAAGQQLLIEESLLPVMRNHPAQQWIELLSATPQNWSIGAALKCEVSGEPFKLPQTATTALLIAEDIGIAPITFLAERFKKERRHSLLVLFGFNHELPFRPAPSRIMVNDLPAGVIATMPLLEDWAIPCRIAHADEPPGCFGGEVLELARHWLQHHHAAVDLYLCGDKQMCEAGVSLAQEFDLECHSITVIN